MSGRSVVVTGGSSGIGREICARFRAEGDRVHVVDRNPPLDGFDHVPCDLSDPNAIEAAVSSLPPSIDVLVNAAGVTGKSDVRTVMAVNLYAVRQLTTVLAPRMPIGGCVVNIASTSGWYWRDHLAEIRALLSASTEQEKAEVVASLVPDGHTAYARSKEAVIVWSVVAAQQLLGRVRVVSISPGPIETPLLAEFYEVMGQAELDPLTSRAGGRNGRPAEVAAVALWLASAEAYWVNGTDISVDHGAEMAEFLAGHDLIAPLART